MAIRTLTTSVTATQKLDALAEGFIPVGMPGNDWGHITPTDLADSVKKQVEEAVQADFVEAVSTAVTENIQQDLEEKVSTAVTAKMDEAKDGIISEATEAATTAATNSVNSTIDQKVATKVQTEVNTVVTNKVQTIVQLEIQNQGGVSGGSTITPELKNISARNLTIKPADVARPTTYKCGTMTSITVSTLPVNLHEITVLFTSGTTATTLSLPSGFKSVGTISIVKSKDYVLSILNGIVAVKALN